MSSLIEFEDVSYTYHSAGAPPVSALQHINLQIAAGEFLALIGHNGSGKSTLARLCNALLLPSEGRITVAGLNTSLPQHRTSIAALVGMVFQQPQDQIVANLVEEDVAFGPANLGLPTQQLQLRVNRALQASGIAHLRGRPTHLLSAGESQRVALAGVLAMQPRCLIFDETSAMLDPLMQAEFLHILNDLHHQGYTVLLITHRMSEALQADRVVALHQGRIALQGSPAHVFAARPFLQRIGLDQPLLHRMVFSLRKYFPDLPQVLRQDSDLLASIPPYRGSQSLKKAHSVQKLALATKVIDVHNLKHTYLQDTPIQHLALQDVSLQVSAAELHALVGPTGAGKSTLLQHLNALLRPQSGSVRVLEWNLAEKELDVRALRRKVGLVFQIPEQQFFEYYVGDEVAYGPRTLDVPGNLREQVRNALECVGLDFEQFKDRPLYTLSGGEQRRVALASFFAIDNDIYLLDEPFAGLDPQTHRDMRIRVQSILERGKTVLLSTHDMQDVLTMCTRLTAIQAGSDVFQGVSFSLFTDEELLTRSGLSAPLLSRLLVAFRQKGWPLNPALRSFTELLDALHKIKEVENAAAF